MGAPVEGKFKHYAVCMVGIFLILANFIMYGQAEIQSDRPLTSGGMYWTFWIICPMIFLTICGVMIIKALILNCRRSTDLAAIDQMMIAHATILFCNVPLMLNALALDPRNGNYLFSRTLHIVFLFLLNLSTAVVILKVSTMNVVKTEAIKVDVEGGLDNLMQGH